MATSNPPSRRKPFNGEAGYIASLRSGANRGWIVIYEAKEQGLDVGGRYAVCCKTHGALLGVRSMPAARSAMKAADFCDDCRGRA